VITGTRVILADSFRIGYALAFAFANIVIGWKIFHLLEYPELRFLTASGKILLPEFMTKPSAAP